MPRDFHDIEIFVEGVHKGELWTADRIKRGVENWHKLRAVKNSDGRPLLDPPLWLGHEDIPGYEGATNLPRLGNPDNLTLYNRPDDGRLAVKASLLQVHNDLATWIDEGKVRDISAEWYPDWIDEKGVHHGPVLRRVCCLGGTPPAVKSLNAFGDTTDKTIRLAAPVMAFGDDQPTLTVKLPFRHKGNSMTRDQVNEKLRGVAKQKGFPLTDAALKMFSDDAANQLLTDLSAAPDPTPPPVPITLADVDRLITSKITDAIKPLDQKITRFGDEVLTGSKADRANRVLDWAQDDSDGKGRGNARILPAQRDAIFSRLMRADAINPVVKLADGKGGEKAVTDFDAQIAEIRALPVVLKFGDVLPVAGKDGKIVTPNDQTIADATAYAQRRNKAGKVTA